MKSWTEGGMTWNRRRKQNMSKVTSDLEKMGKDRRKAEEEYLEHRDYVLEVKRIENEGISDANELLTYLVAVIEGVEHSEDLARAANNAIVYSEAIGIKREMQKIVKLVMKSGTVTEQGESEGGTEESHRAENDGQEAYQ